MFAVQATFKLADGSNHGPADDVEPTLDHLARLGSSSSVNLAAVRYRDPRMANAAHDALPADPCKQQIGQTWSLWDPT